MRKEIIIIGAGAAGLQAARRLCREGNTVTVLEAASEPGGRILSLPAGTQGGFSMITEGGAEFVHGELALTEALAREAGVHLTVVDAKMEHVGGERDQAGEREPGGEGKVGEEGSDGEGEIGEEGSDGGGEADEESSDGGDEVGDEGSDGEGEVGEGEADGEGEVSEVGSDGEGEVGEGEADGGGEVGEVGSDGEGEADEEGSHMDWGLLLNRMKMLPEDKPLSDFLESEFPGPEHAALRESAQRMAEGYDLADLHTVSTRSLYKEWAGEEDEAQYRVDGGYRRLIDYLVADCVQHGCRVCFSTVVSLVRWEKGRVWVETVNGQVFSAEALVTTVSLGVLKAGVIRFQPDLPAQWRAVGDLGYGSVIKVLLEFDRVFWDAPGAFVSGDFPRKEAGRTLFILSDEAVPTWWTQSADNCPLITAWISGDRMRVFRGLDDSGRRESCLRSLASIFGVDVSVLRASLRAYRVFDWASAPFVLGGYSFETIGSAAARRLLSQPVEGTLFFAGEGLYEGDVPGTVEAAFCSGVKVAEDVLRNGA